MARGAARPNNDRPMLRCLMNLATLRAPILAAMLALGAGSAWAERSRLGDEADVVEAGDCEIELGATRSATPGSAAERHMALQLTCGVGARTELALTLERTRGAAGERARAVEAKTALTARRGEAAGWALKYGLAWQREPPQRWRDAEVFVALELTRELARRWLLEAELGTQRSRPDRRDATIWSAAVEYALVPGHWEVRGELSGDDRSRPSAATALRWLVWPEHAVLGLGLGRRGGPYPERRVSLALTIEL
jgi:hypothetical protein